MLWRPSGGAVRCCDPRDISGTSQCIVGSCNSIVRCINNDQQHPVCGKLLERFAGRAQLCQKRLNGRRIFAASRDKQRKAEGNREFIPSYLWRVAYSSLVDEIRRLESRHEEPLEDGHAMVGVPVSAANPEQECASREIGAAVQDCLAALVQARRLAVSLYLQGYGVPEAARVLGWGRKRVENLVYRGLADLRRCLREKGFEP